MIMRKRQIRLSAALTVLSLTVFALTLTGMLLHFSQSPETVLFGLLPAGLSFCILCLFLRFLQREQDEEGKLAASLSKIPGFLCRFRYDSGLTLLNYSEGLLFVTGYSAAELHHEFQNQLIRLIVKEDRPEVWQNMLEQLNRSNTLELRYRLRRKDGSALWVLEKGSLAPGRTGAPEFYGIFMEITASQESKEDLCQNLERYKTAVQKCGCTIFEYCPDSGCACCLSGQSDFFGCKPEDPFPQAMAQRGDVHPDDAEKFLALFEKIRTGVQTAQGDFRLKSGDGPFFWYRFRLTAVYDEAGNPVRAIGQISDITTQKQEVQKLLHRAQRDELTGLLNRAAATQLMESALSEHEACALMMIDIDHFKEINDSMGHLAGDAILSEIGAELKKQFRSTDLVARLGGDEFAVLLKNVSDRGAVAEKAADVQNGLSALFSDNSETRRINCSIGIACSPEDGDCFQVLYAKADNALYRAKRAGRNRYFFFGAAAGPAAIL